MGIILCWHAIRLKFDMYGEVRLKISNDLFNALYIETFLIIVVSSFFGTSTASDKKPKSERAVYKLMRQS